MIEKKYKTPNGNILTEGELKNEYGERFDSLVQDNTFMEINLGEGEVKKKRIIYTIYYDKNSIGISRTKDKGKTFIGWRKTKENWGIGIFHWRS